MELKHLSLAFAIAIAFGARGLAAQEAPLNLPHYNALHVHVSSHVNLRRVKGPLREVLNPIGYLKGMIEAAFRGTGKFSRVDENVNNVSSGIVLNVQVTRFRVVSGLGRAFGGALAGKDQIGGTVRLVDMATKTVLGTAKLGGKGAGGTAFNLHEYANIYAAIGNFVQSVVRWSGETPNGFGRLPDWQGVLRRSQPLDVRCTGVEETGLGSRLHYSSQELCEILEKDLRAARANVVHSSPIVLSLHAEALGVPDPRSVVFIGRWRITDHGRVVHDGLVTSVSYKSKPRNGFKRFKENAAAVFQLQIRNGISAFWPDVQWPK